MGKKFFVFSIFCLSVLAAVCPAFAQGSLNVQIHTSEAVPFTDTLGYSVDVFLSALDPDGTPMNDLNPGNFRLWEDSKEQTLTNAVAVENESMSLVLLMDMSGSMLGQTLIDSRNAASRFLERLGRNDRSAVMMFNETPTVMQNFTSDHLASSEAALQANAENGRGTCLYDSIYAAMEMILTEPEGRRAVVVFTDGKDELANGQICSTKLVDDVLKFSEENRIPIYTMGLGTKIDERDLKRIGESSGGSFIKAPSGAAMDDAFSKLYDQLNNEYKLTYESEGSAGPHTILVEVSGRDSAFGRDSYNITLPVAPTIMKFESPKENAQINGQTVVSVFFVSQSAEISRVEFSCNGQFIGSALSRPYEFTWDVSKMMPQDNLVLEAVAIDKAGAEMARAFVPVSIIETPADQKPSIEFTTPHQGEEHQGEVRLSVSVFAPDAEVGSVEYFYNGKSIDRSIEAPYTIIWDISNIPSGNSNISAVAYSKDNRELARTTVMIYVHPMPTPTPEPTEVQETPEYMKPEIEFSSLEEGNGYQGSVELSAMVRVYDTEVGSVEYFYNGRSIDKSIEAPYTVIWDISAMDSGKVSVSAVAYSKDNRELARTSKTIYILAVPTPTPTLIPTATSTPTVTPTIEVTPTPNKELEGVLFQNKILMYGLGALVLIIIIALILLGRKKPAPAPTETQEFKPKDVDGSAAGSGYMAGITGQSVLATLEVLECDDKTLIGSTFNVTTLPLSLGRAADNDVVFSKLDRAVSGHHAVLEDVNGQIGIRDAHSKYGTFVNEEQIGEKPFILESGAKLRLGPRATLIYTRMFASVGGNDETTVDGIQLGETRG